MAIGQEGGDDQFDLATAADDLAGDAVDETGRVVVRADDGLWAWGIGVFQGCVAVRVQSYTMTPRMFSPSRIAV